MKIKGCNCWEWAGLTGGKRAFLSTSMFDGWPRNIWPSCLHHQHAPCDGYSPPQVPALLRTCVHHDHCLLWMDCEGFFRRHMSLLSLHTTVVMSPLVLTRMSPRCNLSVFWGPWAFPFYVATLSHDRKFFFSGPNHETGQGRKRSCPCTVYVQIRPPQSDY